MVRFGAYLMQRGVLTRAQLEEATQSQVVFGGRLGTNLVELGFLRLDALEAHLSGHLGVPVAPAAWVEAPSKQALAAIRADLAGRHGVLPLALEKRTLHVAMLDPNHPERVDDVGFATGLRVRPYVLSELRLSALLEHHYGIPRDTRYINLGRDAARGRTAGAAAVAADPSTEPIDGPDGRADLIDEATFSSLHGNWNCAPASLEPELPLPSVSIPSSPSPPVGVPSAASLERELAVAADRDTVGRLALRIARFHSDAAALFVVRGGMIAGFCGDGSSIPANIDGILIPADADSIFAAPASERKMFRGFPREQGLDGRVLAALGRRGRRATLVIPISVRDRVINLLYVDADGAEFGELDVAALVALCRCVGDAYERIVIAHKRAIG